MYMVNFYVNNVEIKPPVVYNTLEHAQKAVRLWEEVINYAHRKDYHTATITKI